MLIKDSVKSFVQLLSSKIFVQTLNLITLPIVLRYFVPSEYGKVALYQAVYGLLAIFLFFTHHAKARFGREEYDATGNFRKTFWSVFFIKLPIVLFAGISIFYFHKYIENYIGLSSEIIVVLLFLTFLSPISNNIDFLNVQEKYGIMSLLGLVDVLTRLMLIAFLLFAVFPPYAILLILINLFGTIVQFIITFFLLYRQIGLPLFDWRWTKDILIFSLPFLIHVIGATTVGYIDVIVIRKYLPLSDVGVYAVSYKINCILFVPLTIMMTMLMPRIISLYNQNQHEQISWFYSRFTPQISFIISQIFCFFMLFLPLLPLIIGQKYNNAISPLAVLLISFSAAPYVYLMVPMFYASKKVWPHILSNGVMALTNVAFDFILIPKVGIIGGAISTALAGFMSLFIHSYFFNYYFRISNLKNIVFGFPLIIVSLMVAFHVDWIYIITVYLLSGSFAWLLTKHYGFYDMESAKFFEKLGLPPFLSNFILKVYSSLLVLTEK
jgi:O-antigen/teichoic acid export membrane protein